MFSRLPITLVQLQAGKNSQKLKKKDNRTTAFTISLKKTPKQSLNI